MAQFGRDNLAEISKRVPTKTLDELTEYHHVFWQRGPIEIKDFNRVIAPLLKKQLIEEKMENAAEALNWKLNSYNCIENEFEMKPNKGQREKLKFYTRESNVFILKSLQKHGIQNPDVYNLIRRDVL